MAEKGFAEQLRDGAKFLGAWTQGNEFHSGRWLPADMRAKNRDTEASSNVLNPGSCAIDLLHDFWGKSRPVTKPRQPGAVARSIFA